MSWSLYNVSTMETKLSSGLSAALPFMKVLRGIARWENVFRESRSAQWSTWLRDSPDIDALN